MLEPPRPQGGAVVVWSQEVTLWEVGALIQSTPDQVLWILAESVHRCTCDKWHYGSDKTKLISASKADMALIVMCRRYLSQQEIIAPRL